MLQSLQLYVSILQSCERVLSSLFQSGFRSGSTSMLEAYSGGKVDDVLSHIGWFLGRAMVLKAYFRQIGCSRISGGGWGASNSMGTIGDVRNAPRILLQAVFCSLCSLLMYPFCPLHKASAT